MAASSARVSTNITRMLLSLAPGQVLGSPTNPSYRRAFRPVSGSSPHVPAPPEPTEEHPRNWAQAVRAEGPSGSTWQRTLTPAGIGQTNQRTAGYSRSCSTTHAPPAMDDQLHPTTRGLRRSLEPL